MIEMMLMPSFRSFQDGATALRSVALRPDSASILGACACELGGYGTHAQKSTLHRIMTTADHDVIASCLTSRKIKINHPGEVRDGRPARRGGISP
ncbi:hypothetical protein [Prosthecomicrobium pneumaticum]|uniref:Uncharacterized protein n=1 Tax=Prosthecomicrobium pneumaticum TaxID=81895 RepID=A0A7W9FKI7_9HYPH|nr:hypothetical protein [Prosthecomicrobium pneumaticum]MBB5752575.1 hypothetical protein [Prosthecomicrobium pneumaticum]